MDAGGAANVKNPSWGWRKVAAEHLLYSQEF